MRADSMVEAWLLKVSALMHILIHSLLMLSSGWLLHFWAHLSNGVFDWWRAARVWMLVLVSSAKGFICLQV